MGSPTPLCATPGLTSDEDITVLNSSGFAIQDLYAARQLLERRIAT